jgi:hypothetical protein
MLAIDHHQSNMAAKASTGAQGFGPAPFVFPQDAFFAGLNLLPSARRRGSCTATRMVKWKVAYKGPPESIELPQGGYLCPACFQQVLASELKLGGWDIAKVKLECLSGEAHRFSARNELAS